MATSIDMSNMTAEHKELASLFKGSHPQDVFDDFRKMVHESLINQADAMRNGVVVDADLLERSTKFYKMVTDMITSIAHLLTDEELDYIMMCEQNVSEEDDSDQDFPEEK